MLAIGDLARISLRQLRRQPGRTSGVLLTIMLGIAGFIVINTAGRDVQRNLGRDLELLGGLTIVKVYYADDRGFHPPAKFRPSTLAALRDLPGVAGLSAMAMKMTPARTVLGDRRHTFTLVGVDEEFWGVNRFAAVSGRLFSPDEILGRERVCVLGARLAGDLFGAKAAVGEHLAIDGDLYLVTGLVDGANVGDRDRWAFVPVTTALDRVYPLIPPNRLYLSCRTMDDVRAVSAAVPGIVAGHQSTEGLQVEVGWQQWKQARRIIGGVQTFIRVSVAATLALGGFGMWMIMMAAVRARTREIGIKKALGAEDREILAQFLTEAAILSLGAGVLGMAAGRLGVEGVCRALHTAVSPEQVWLYMGAGLGLAMGLGLGAGLYPALRASRMEIVSAVKYE